MVHGKCLTLEQSLRVRCLLTQAILFILLLETVYYFLPRYFPLPVLSL